MTTEIAPLYQARTLSGLSDSSKKDDSSIQDSATEQDTLAGRWYSRSRYALSIYCRDTHLTYGCPHSFSGALLINFVTFLLPALYGTLSKLWIANIDNSVLATTDTYTDAGTVTEVINEGLPRAAFLIIANKAGRTIGERASLSVTLVTFQAVLGLILSVALLGAAPRFASAFVPVEYVYRLNVMKAETERPSCRIAARSTRYVRIAAFSYLFGSMSTSISAATRSLDRPDVPLVISICSTVLNIVLDMIFLSTFRPSHIQPTIEMQAAIRLACDGFAAFVGLGYFVWTLLRLSRDYGSPRFSFAGLKILAKAGAPFFIESTIRNALYLYQSSSIIGLSADYATAWGVFNTIRWGLIMVAVSTLAATAEVFVGHRYGLHNKLRHGKPATWNDLYCQSRQSFVGTRLMPSCSHRYACTGWRCYRAPHRNRTLPATNFPPHLSFRYIHFEQLSRQCDRSAYVEVYRLVLCHWIRTLHSAGHDPCRNATHSLPCQLTSIECPLCSSLDHSYSIRSSVSYTNGASVVLADGYRSANPTTNGSTVSFRAKTEATTH